MTEASISPVRRALSGTVQRLGSLEKVSASDTDADCADLRITLTGGTAGLPAQAEIVVTLNTSLGSSGITAQLIDETAASRPVVARKSGNRFVFGPGSVAFGVIVGGPDWDSAKILKKADIENASA